MSRRETIMLILLAAIVVLVGGGFAINWYIKDMARLLAEKAVKAEDLKRVEEKCADLEKVEEQLAEAKRLQEEYERLVPKDMELPQLLRDTATMLTTAGVKLTGFRPGEPEAVPEVVELNRLSVSVRAEGTYKQLVRMFEVLRSWRRLIGIRVFSVAGEGKESADPKLRCEFDMVVFFTKAQSSSAASATGG